MLKVHFVSQSEKRGRARVAAVLDRYAIRVGDAAWQTPITAEGLSVVKAAVKRVATRQTSVSCFQETSRGSQLLWSIGRSVGRLDNGAIPVHRHQARRRDPIPSFLKIASLLNEMAGLAHDLGKASSFFQNKIRGQGPLADAVRHEWISYRLLDGLLDQNLSWDAAWAMASSSILGKDSQNLLNTPFGCKNNAAGMGHPPLRSWRETLDFLVASHHRLPGGTQDEQNFRGGRHPHGKTFFNEKEFAKLRAVDFFHPPHPSVSLDEPLRRLRKLAQRLVSPQEPPAPSCGGTRLSTSKWASKNLSNLPVERRPSLPDHPTFSSPDFWLALSFLARPALILADHEQSSVMLGVGNAGDGVPRLFANTAKTEGKEQDKRVLNQPLEWHLGAVGRRAAEIVKKMWQFTPSGVSDETRAKLETPASPNTSYSWQNRAADFLSSLPTAPTLVLNLAGTGCGKTRMNMRALAALAKNKPLRIASALNLRSLTLQTIDAYKDQFGIPESELAGVIGDSLTARLHEQAKNKEDSPSAAQDHSFDDDENEYQGDFSPICGQQKHEPPEWLVHALKKNDKMASVVLSPVVACTTDFLATGMDLPRQGNQATAFMRLMNSDLILDEIDGYDPSALVSVSRLVMCSAMFGRNVVASSATLSEPCAELLWLAWRRGTELRAALLGENTNSQVALIDHATSMSIFSKQASGALFSNGVAIVSATVRDGLVETKSAPDFKQSYRARLHEILQKGREYAILRRPRLIGVDSTEKSKKINFVDWENSVAAAVVDFHNQWKKSIDPEDPQGATFSVGLVRVANIKTAVQLARHLAGHSHLKNIAKICCYHSNLTRLRRFHIEKNLDLVLTRKINPLGGENQHLVGQVAHAGQKDTVFIVVATPVEEIGRDHDFDWAVIEPSSVQSIVQTAGRVNRHRQRDLRFEPEKTNVGVMNINAKMARNFTPNEWKSIFFRPGFDVGESSYREIMQKEKKSIEMSDLIDWGFLAKVGLDAGLKFDMVDGVERHRFSQLDNQSLSDCLDFPRVIFGNEGLGGAASQLHWFNDDFYRFFLLRDRGGAPVDVSYLIHPKTIVSGGRATVFCTYYDPSIKGHAPPKRVSIETVSACANNDWLVLSDEDACALQIKMGLQDQEAHSVCVGQSTPDADKVAWDESFGMCPITKKK
jgi:CRISPR-associated endonuclease/helicase Cas3